MLSWDCFAFARRDGKNARRCACTEASRGQQPQSFSGTGEDSLLKFSLLERGVVVFASITLVSSGLWHAPRIGYRRVLPSERRSRYAAAPATRPPAMIIPSPTNPPTNTTEPGSPNRKSNPTNAASPTHH